VDCKRVEIWGRRVLKWVNGVLGYSVYGLAAIYGKGFKQSQATWRGGRCKIKDPEHNLKRPALFQMSV
jgi:hypothetical protein